MAVATNEGIMKKWLIFAAVIAAIFICTYAWAPTGDPVLLDSNEGVSIPQSSTQAGYWRGQELSGNGTNFMGWEVPDAITDDLVFKLTDTNPDGSVMVFAAPSGGQSAQSWKSVPSGDFVGTSDTQILTNKTIDGASNTLKLNTIGTFGTPITTNPYTLTAANSYFSKLYYGATGQINLSDGVDGMNIIIYNTGAFTITINPDDSDPIVRDGTAQSAGVSMTLSSGAGNYVAMSFEGEKWVTCGYKGTLAAGS